jgi:hypothetical protein
MRLTALLAMAALSCGTPRSSKDLAPPPTFPYGGDAPEARVMNERIEPAVACLSVHPELGKGSVVLAGKNDCDASWTFWRTDVETRAGDPTCPNGHRAEAPCPNFVVPPHEPFTVPVQYDIGRPQRAGETHFRAYVAGPGLREYRIETRLGDQAVLVAFDVANPGK